MNTVLSPPTNTKVLKYQNKTRQRCTLGKGPFFYLERTIYANNSSAKIYISNTKGREGFAVCALQHDPLLHWGESQLQYTALNCTYLYFLPILHTKPSATKCAFLEFSLRSLILWVSTVFKYLLFSRYFAVFNEVQRRFCRLSANPLNLRHSWFAVKFFYRFFYQDLRFLSCIFNWVVFWGFVCFDRCNCCEKQSEVSFSGFTILSPIPLCFDIDRRFRGNFGDDGSEGVVCLNTKRPPIIRRLWAERFDIWWGDDNCGRW